MEETGLVATRMEYLYEAPTVATGEVDRGRVCHVFRVEASGEPRESEPGCPVAWLTREQFLAESPFARFYAKMWEVVGKGEAR